MNVGDNLLGFRPSSEHAFSLDATVRAKPVDGRPAGADVVCRLDQFAIGFAGVPAVSGAAGDAMTAMIQNADVSLVFDRLQFKMTAGEKPDIDLVFKDIHFGGDLKFIETIKSVLPLDGFSDPPYVHVDLTGLTAGFSLSIPNLAVGVFSLENMKIEAKLVLPFIVDDIGKGLTFSFDFCTPDHPFLVTVALLGGGGYFGIEMNMHGLSKIKAAIEVCAQLSFDFGIASGSLSIEVGVYIELDTQSSSSYIKGYLRLRGELDVGGVVTISLEWYVSIEYHPDSGKVVASGYISVDVHLFFFSVSAKIPFSRTFAGSNGDPTFADIMKPGVAGELPDPMTNAVWDPLADYCVAFA
jgi:hypothetical protein